MSRECLFKALLGVLAPSRLQKSLFCLSIFETSRQASETEKDLLEILHRFLHRTF